MCWSWLPLREMVKAAQSRYKWICHGWFAVGDVLVLIGSVGDVLATLVCRYRWLGSLARCLFCAVVGDAALIFKCKWSWQCFAGVGDVLALIHRDRDGGDGEVEGVRAFLPDRAEHHRRGEDRCRRCCWDPGPEEQVWFLLGFRHLT